MVLTGSEPPALVCLRRLLSDLGVLRSLLLLLVLVSIASAPFAGGETVLSFPQVLPTLVAPPLAVMLAFALPLDALMCAVFRAGATPGGRARYTRVLRVEITALIVLVAVWSPFFWELTGR